MKLVDAYHDINQNPARSNDLITAGASEDWAKAV